MTGCSFDCNYGLTIVYNVVNKTDSDIILVRGMGGSSETETVIIPKKEVIVLESHGMCCKNYVPTDDYGHRLLNYVPSFNLKVNGKIVSRKIWEGICWNFTSQVYRATYAMTVTDELIESVGFEDE